MTMQNNQDSVLLELPIKAFISVNWKNWSEFNFQLLGPDGILFFQFLVYHCASLEPQHEGWFYHSKEQIEARLGIKRERLDKIVKTLIGIGALATVRRGLPARLFYKIQFSELTKAKVLEQIYNQPSPEKLKELAEVFKRCGLSKPAPKTKKEANANEIATRNAEALLNGLIQVFRKRRESYNEGSSKNSTKVLENAPLPIKQSHIAMAKNVLVQYTREQIFQGFNPYCDLLNFSNGGTPKGHHIFLEFECPKRDVLSYFLSSKRDFEVLRTCITAGYNYGYFPK